MKRNLVTYRWNNLYWFIVLVLCLMGQGEMAMAQEVKAISLSDTLQTIHKHERKPVTINDSTTLNSSQQVRVVNVAGDTITFSSIDSIRGIDNVEILIDSTASPLLGQVREFNPDPQRALWLSALCPGLGQIYNHRYWKLPIVVGAFVGLTYGAAWNNRMYKDYSKGYRDVMDDDPNTHSYMDFFPPTVKESELDMAWLQKILKSKRDYYRRYKEICIISMVGVYLINIVDAYVDASLAHFDISPDLTLDISPAAIDNNLTLGQRPSVGIQCAISF